MDLFRAVLPQFAKDPFSGKGGLFASGRWHSKGRLVVYTSATPSLALLESLANYSKNDLMSGIQIVTAYLPENVVMHSIDAATLPSNWTHYPAPNALKAIGDHWLDGGKSAVLAVPSAVMPLEKNYLLNPAHPDFSKLRIGNIYPHLLDKRITGR